MTLAGTGVLPVWSKRHQQRDRHILRLKHPSHVDDVVGPLRVAHQHDRVSLALRALTPDFVRGGLPLQMPGHLRADALGFERVGDGVEARREHTEPAPQQNHTRFGAGGTAIEAEDNRNHSYARTDIPTAALHALTPKTLMRHLIWKA